MKKILSIIILVTFYNLVSSETLSQQLKCTISQAKKDRLGRDLFAAVKDAKLSKKERLLQVESLLDQGADSNSKDSDGNTPLHWATSLDIVHALLQAGADPNSKNNDDYTPLHFAQTLDIVHALLQVGVDPNSINKWGDTPLHFAESSDIVYALLQVGADPNSINKLEEIPLHCAQSPDIVHALVQAGSDLNSKDNEGHTPLRHHIFMKSFDVAHVILQNGFLYGGYSLQEVEDNIEKYPQLGFSIPQLQSYVSEHYSAHQYATIKQFIAYVAQHTYYKHSSFADESRYFIINKENEAYKKHCEILSQNLQRSPTHQDLNDLGIVKGFVPLLQQLCVRFIVQKVK